MNFKDSSPRSYIDHLSSKLFLSHLKVRPVYEISPHFGNFLPVARYEVEMRNYIHKMYHRVHEVIKTRFRISDELYSLARDVVCVYVHGQVEHGWVHKRELASPESGFTWNTDRRGSDAGLCGVWEGSTCLKIVLLNPKIFGHNEDEMSNLWGTDW